MIEQAVRTQSLGKIYNQIRPAISRHYPGSSEGRMAASVCCTIFEDLAHWQFAGRFLPQKTTKHGYSARKNSFKARSDALTALNHPDELWYVEGCGVSRDWLKRKAEGWGLL